MAQMTLVNDSSLIVCPWNSRNARPQVVPSHISLHWSAPSLHDIYSCMPGSGRQYCFLVHKDAPHIHSPVSIIIFALCFDPCQTAALLDTQCTSDLQYFLIPPHPSLFLVPVVFINETILCSGETIVHVQYSIRTCALLWGAATQRTCMLGDFHFYI